MKISVQFEADSAAEYDRILEALSGPGRAMFVAPEPVKSTPKTPEEALKQVLADAKEIQARVEPAPAQAAPPLPVEPPVGPEPAPVETVVEAPEQPVKRRPGRPKVMKPVVEEPEEEPVETSQRAPEASQRAPDLSHLDVKGAFRDYVIRYGTSNGYNDVPDLLTKAFGKEIRKAEHVPNDQSSLKKAIALITQALNDNPYNRKVVNAA